MKVNLTLKPDPHLPRKARVVAAEQGLSLNVLMADSQEAIGLERKAYSKARRRALARLRRGLDLRWTRSRCRTELHER
jgi:hypothetical protein